MRKLVDVTKAFRLWSALARVLATVGLFAFASSVLAQQALYPQKEGIVQPLRSSENPRMTLDMELRGRTEEQTSLGFVSGKDRLYELTRVWGGMTVVPTNWLTVYGQFMDLHALGLPLQDTAANMRDTFDLRQGYLDFHYKPVQFVVGRQELRIGDERVVGISDWTNTSRTWDGFYMRVGNVNQLNLFSTSVVTVHPTSLDTHGAGLTFHGAQAKLAKIVKMIGFPDKWRTYDFEVKRDDFGGDVLRAAAFDTHRVLARAGKPVDRGEWPINAFKVDAQYSATANGPKYSAVIGKTKFITPIG